MGSRNDGDSEQKLDGRQQRAIGVLVATSDIHTQLDYTDSCK